MIRVSIPLLFRDITGDVREAEVVGRTLGEVVAALDAIHPGIASRIHDGEKIAPNVALTVDGRIAASGLSTPVGPDSQVAILPAFGGGC